jgi:hypothetical protein
MGVEHCPGWLLALEEPGVRAPGIEKDVFESFIKMECEIATFSKCLGS